MSNSSEALVQGFAVQFRGQTIRFAEADNIDVVTEYECYLEAEAWATLRRAKQYLNTEELAAQSDGIRRDIVARVYAEGSPHYAASMNNAANQKQLLWLMGRYLTPGLEREVIEDLYTDKEVMKEIMTKMQGAADPNRKSRSGSTARPAATA